MMIFFHLTCHVDAILKKRIEMGEFVELEKLLMKNRTSLNSDGLRMQLVSREEGTFIVPAEKENKITNVRCWEQAFRIYAAIYSNANPNRSAEIWQYVFVINSVASTFMWDNVASYDYTFRQLMACNPKCSWAKIYLQMWNLTMRDTITKGSFSVENRGVNSSWGGKQQNSARKQKKNNYCWALKKKESNAYLGAIVDL